MTGWFSLFLFALVVLSFWLPFRWGHRSTARMAGGGMALVYVASLLSEDFVFIGYALVALFGLVFNAYWVLRSLRIRPAGKIVAITFGGLLALLVLPFQLEDVWFFRSDASELLAQNQLELKDAFAIEAHSITGIMNFRQDVELCISSQDQARLMFRLRHSPFYRGRVEDVYAPQPPLPDSATAPPSIIDYETDQVVGRKVLHPSQPGFANWHDHIMVSKTEPTLRMVRDDEMF